GVDVAGDALGGDAAARAGQPHVALHPPHLDAAAAALGVDRADEVEGAHRAARGAQPRRALQVGDAEAAAAALHVDAGLARHLDLEVEVEPVAPVEPAAEPAVAAATVDHFRRVAVVRELEGVALVDRRLIAVGGDDDAGAGRGAAGDGDAAAGGLHDQLAAGSEG